MAVKDSTQQHEVLNGKMRPWVRPQEMVCSVRARVEEWARAEDAARRAGITRNAWCRRAIVRQADLEEAMMLMERDETARGVLVDRTPPQGGGS